MEATQYEQMLDKISSAKLFDLTGKVALITGASRGIGRDIAIGLAKYGAAVVVAARTEKEREGLRGTIYETVEMIQAMGVKGLAIPTDVTNEESVQNMVSKIHSYHPQSNHDLPSYLALFEQHLYNQIFF